MLCLCQEQRGPPLGGTNWQDELAGRIERMSASIVNYIEMKQQACSGLFDPLIHPTEAEVEAIRLPIRPGIRSCSGSKIVPPIRSRDCSNSSKFVPPIRSRYRSNSSFQFVPRIVQIRPSSSSQGSSIDGSLPGSQQCWVVAKNPSSRGCYQGPINLGLLPGAHQPGVAATAP